MSERSISQVAKKDRPAAKRRGPSDRLPDLAPTMTPDERTGFICLARSLMGSGSRTIILTGATQGVGTSFVAHGILQAGRDLNLSVKVDPAETNILSDPATLDIRLIDSQPIVDSSQTQASVAESDGVVLVVEAEKTTRRQIDHALAVIDGCGGTCLGLVLNKRRGDIFFR